MRAMNLFKALLEQPLLLNEYAGQKDVFIQPMYAGDAESFGVKRFLNMTTIHERQRKYPRLVHVEVPIFSRNPNGFYRLYAVPTMNERTSLIKQNKPSFQTTQALLTHRPEWLDGFSVEQLLDVANLIPLKRLSHILYIEQEYAKTLNATIEAAKHKGTKKLYESHEPNPIMTIRRMAVHSALAGLDMANKYGLFYTKTPAQYYALITNNANLDVKKVVDYTAMDAEAQAKVQPYIDHALWQGRAKKLQSKPSDLNKALSSIYVMGWNVDILTALKGSVSRAKR